MCCRWSISLALHCILVNGASELSCAYMHTHRCSMPTLRLILNRLLAFLGSSTNALLQWRNHRSPSTKSPNQAPTASPITPDPTKASNVTIPCGTIQRNNLYPRRLWTLVSCCFSCIFWLLSVALFVLSHYVYICTSIYITTNNKHQAPTSSPITSDPTIVSS